MKVRDLYWALKEIGNLAGEVFINGKPVNNWAIETGFFVRESVQNDTGQTVVGDKYMYYGDRPGNEYMNLEYVVAINIILEEDNLE